MSSFCECCEYVAQNHSTYLKHLGTKKHAKRYLETIKNMENPNQNIVFSHLSKERVQETQNKQSEKKGRKGTLKKKWEENVQEEVPQNTQNTHLEENVQEEVPQNTQNTHLEENVQEGVPQKTQNTHLEENVQEPTDFVFLDMRLVELYKTISRPIHPTFSWFIWLFISITGLFRPFHKKTDEKDISGNE